MGAFFSLHRNRPVLAPRDCSQTVRETRKEIFIVRVVCTMRKQRRGFFRYMQNSGVHAANRRGWRPAGVCARPFQGRAWTAAGQAAGDSTRRAASGAAAEGFPPRVERRVSRTGRGRAMGGTTGAAGFPGRAGGASVHGWASMSIRTLPHSPVRTVCMASSKLASGKRWVSMGASSAPWRSRKASVRYQVSQIRRPVTP